MQPPHEGLDLGSASETVVVSNTPEFLFKCLRSDETVQALAERTDGRSIVSWLRQWAANGITDAKLLVLVYVYIAALAIKQDMGAIDELSSLDLVALPWGEAMKSLLIASVKPTTSIVVTSDLASPTLEPPPRAVETANTQVNTTVTPSLFNIGDKP